MTQHVALDLLRNAEINPDAPLMLLETGESFSYGTISERAHRGAQQLIDFGVRPSDRVLVLLPNGVDYLTAYYSCLIVGATAVGLQFSSPNDLIIRVQQDCTPAVCITTPGHPAAGSLSKIGILSPDDLISAPAYSGSPLGGGESIAQLIYTSGTTGDPKGVMLSHRALSENTSSIVEYLQLKALDRVGVVLDFVYSYGNSLLLTHIRVGGSLALLGSLLFPQRVLRRLAELECTGFSGVPSTFALLLQRGRPENQSWPKLEYVTCAGGGLPPANVARVRNLFPGIKIILMYGQTEAAARLSYLPDDQLDRKPDSIGKGIPGVHLEVVDPDGTPAGPGTEGEIVASGRNLMSGYWNDPAATQEALRNGKLWTGDLAVVDEDGYIRITGRRSDLIKSGSYRIHPKEIEDAITLMEGVHECAVVGIPDDIWGESPVACFIGTEPALADIRKHLRGRLSEYKWPRHVMTLDAFPRTSSGKVKRRDLAHLVASQIRTSSSGV